MTILVTGATGQLGRLVIDELLARQVPAAEIIAAGRNRETLAGYADRGLRTAEIDYSDPAGLAAAVADVDTVLLISGSEVGQRVAQHGNVIQAAATAGVSRLVYTSAPKADDTVLILAPEHAATEALLRDSGVPFTILRNNWYTENYLDKARQGAATGEIFGNAGRGRVASATRQDYAEATAVVLTTEGHLGRVYELSGDVAWTFDDFAVAVGELAGRTVTYRSVTPEEHTQLLLGAGLDAGTAGFLVALDSNIEAGTLAGTSGELQALIGRPTTSLASGLAVAVTPTA